MNLPSEILFAALRVALAGGVAGIVGGLIGSMRASLLGSLLMGALGGLSLASIVNISGLDPLNSVILDAGEGFSYAWGAIGGAFFGYVVTKSSGSAGKSKMWKRK